MNGDELRQRRELCSASRTDLSKATGLSVGRIAALELGLGKEMSDNELSMLLKFFEPSVQPPTANAGPDPVSTEAVLVPHENDGGGQAGPKLTAEERRRAALKAELIAQWKIYAEEWCGLAKGDVVKIDGTSGTFRFQSYREPHKGQAHVQVYGGPKGHGMFRNFTPDRVLRPNGQRVMT